MIMTRRYFFKASQSVFAGLILSKYALAQDISCKFPVSACDWSLWTEGPEALTLAKEIGLHGVEISAGKPADTLAIESEALRQKYKEKMQETGVKVSSVAMGLLNDAPLATEPRAVKWIESTIDATKDLGATVVLLAFFGKGDLREKNQLKVDDVKIIVEKLKDVSKKAEEKGIILGIENTLSAEQNLDILEQIGSKACKVYYDIGNSTYNGYDVPKEIRMLKDKICQIHFKDGAFYLGKGKVQMEPVKEAIIEIGYQGWIVLETGLPTMNKKNDFRKNLEFVCQLFQ